MTEFKDLDCSITGGLLLVYIHIGKEGMNDRNYHLELGATSDFMKRMI